MKNIFVFMLVSFSFIHSCTTSKKVVSQNQETNEIQNYNADKKDSSKEFIHYPQPDWVKNAVIYEINTRQFSKEGNFAAVKNNLERIKELGVDILWFMPIHPIGIKNRKATEELTYDQIPDSEKYKYYGSHYSVQDFTKVNPDYGTLEEFKDLVKTAHSLGMKVILDWVPNHTAWDHPWITNHPEYYTHKDGKITDPIDPRTGESWGWTDVADLNYENKDLWKAMQSDLVFWLKEADIDGYRCDVASEVPADFWLETRKILDNVKPNFMLAESHDRELLESFNMIYAWELMGLINDFNEGKKTLNDIENYVMSHKKSDLIMNFTANHDENTWNNAPMKYGKNYYNFAILTYFVGGMPLIYNGQEALLTHKLKFFEKDEIIWDDYTDTQFFTKLNTIYKKNEMLWNGNNFGEWKRLDSPEGVFAFAVNKGTKKISVYQNYTDRPIKLTLESSQIKDLLTDKDIKIINNTIEIPAYKSYIF